MKSILDDVIMSLLSNIQADHKRFAFAVGNSYNYDFNGYCKSSCSGSCDYDCSGSCDSSCAGECSDGCYGGCQGSCFGTSE